MGIMSVAELLTNCDEKWTLLDVISGLYRDQLLGRVAS